LIECRKKEREAELCKNGKEGKGVDIRGMEIERQDKVGGR
jgi:hypothetical protein